MKKFLLALVAVVFAATSAFAQGRGDMAAGLNINMGTAYNGGGYTNAGIGIKFQYNVLNKLRLEPEFNFMFPKDNLSMWDLGVNVHYQIPLISRLNIYPIVGLGINGTVLSFGGQTQSDCQFAARFGAGVEYFITRRIAADFEVKYAVVTQSMSHLLLSWGVSYHF